MGKCLLVLSAFDLGEAQSEAEGVWTIGGHTINVQLLFLLPFGSLCSEICNALLEQRCEPGHDI